MNEGGLDYRTLLLVYSDHISVVNTLWSILQFVSLALLGFVYQQQHLRKNWLALSILSIAFLVFAFGNQAAMIRSQQVLVEVVDQMKCQNALSTVPEETGMKSVLQAHDVRRVDQVRLDHTFFSSGVVLLVWLPFVMACFKDRKASETKTCAANPNRPSGD